MKWHIDTKARRVWRSDFAARIYWEDAAWRAEAWNQGEDRSIIELAHGDELREQALTAWRAELRKSADVLEACGRALHGDRWMLHLSDDLGIDQRTIKYWMIGRTPLEMSHPIWRNIREVMTAKVVAIETALDDVPPEHLTEADGRHATVRRPAA